MENITQLHYPKKFHPTASSEAKAFFILAFVRFLRFWENKLSPCQKELWSPNLDNKKTQKHQFSSGYFEKYWWRHNFKITLINIIPPSQQGPFLWPSRFYFKQNFATELHRNLFSEKVFSKTPLTACFWDKQTCSVYCILVLN